MNEISKVPGVKVATLFKDGGPLVEEFGVVGDTMVWNTSFAQPPSERWKNRLKQIFGFPAKSRLGHHHELVLQRVRHADIIFNNTIANVALLRQLNLGDKKVFSYIHELDVVTELLASYEDIKYLDAISEKIFVPAKAVQQFLTSRYQIPEFKIKFLKYIIPPSANFQKTEKFFENHFTSSVQGKFIVGFCGVLDWRKGAEFLPLIANKIVNGRGIRDIHFIWLGVNKELQDYIILKNDLHKLGLTSYCSLIQSKPDIKHIVAQFDILCLPSREDAFPLVVLEAAAAQVPCIYFLNAGGIGEFCENDAGIAVDYLNAEGMVDAIIRLKTDTSMRESMGRRAKQKMLAYSNPSSIVDGLFQEFKKLPG